MPGGDDADLERDDEDDADAIPKSLVDRPRLRLGGRSPAETPWHETVIYEVHVKGFTKRHPDVREDLRGTYAGLASDEAIAHLQELGVTAVELLPIHHIADEEFLVDAGLTNYWGYSLDRVPRAARALRVERPQRRAGARVQGHGQGAPPRGHRGDPRRRLQPHRRGQPPRADALVQGHRQPSYYRLEPDDPRFYTDFTGTGNSLNPVHPSGCG